MEVQFLSGWPHSKPSVYMIFPKIQKLEKRGNAFQVKLLA